MPGRVATASSTTARGRAKKTAPSTREETRTPSPVSPIVEEASELRIEICSIFAEAQRSLATHRKLATRLRSVQEKCLHSADSTNPVRARKNQSTQLYTEANFNVEFMRCVVKVLVVKKGESVADRVVRFIASFLGHAIRKETPEVDEDAMEEDMLVEETPTSLLAADLLQSLHQVLVAKDKSVRFRSCQLIVGLLDTLPAIDDDCYHLIRSGLLKRIRDKEAPVRVQAVLGLCKLAGNEGEAGAEDSDLEDDSAGMLEKLQGILQNDSNAEVRRTALLNLPITAQTLPVLLERARDTDALTRRALYTRLLPALGDFRHLSLSTREKLLRWGLRDRDEAVRKATSQLFGQRWIEDCAGSGEAEEQDGPKQLKVPSQDALLELLERIDVLNAGMDNGIANTAMNEFWKLRPDYLDAMVFDDEFWDNLTAESAYVVRSFNAYCKADTSPRSETLLEDKMPEVTKLGFYLERYANKLIANIKDTSGEIGEEVVVEQEFIVEQLLHIAESADYSDEIGRRKMFSLLRELLASPEFPESTTKLAAGVLRDLCEKGFAGEKEFCGIIYEAIAEVHDTILGDEPDVDDSFHSARSEVTDTTPTKAPRTPPSAEDSEEKAIQEIMINLKCLHIAQCMLENVEGNLQSNSHLVEMLNNLIVPAVRSHEAPIRERGLLCLGLCCLLDEALAKENLMLFVHCFNKGHDKLRATALEILCDILCVQPSLLEDEATKEQVQKSLTKGVKGAQAADVQASAVVSVGKLLLTGAIKDEDLLKALVMAFFDTATRDNILVKQALSYFLPVFSYSKKENMGQIGKIAPGVMHALANQEDELEDDQDSIGLNVVSNVLLDWTDQRKIASFQKEEAEQDERDEEETTKKKDEKVVNCDVHLQLAIDLLNRTMASSSPKSERKIYILMLGKLHVSPDADPSLLAELSTLISTLAKGRLLTEASTRNAVTKFETAISKATLAQRDIVKPGSPAPTVATVMKAEDDEQKIRGQKDEDSELEEFEDADSTIHHGEEDEDDKTGIDLNVNPGEETRLTDLLTETKLEDSLVSGLLDDDEDL